MRRDELRVRDLVLASLLMGMGVVLHAIFPGILAGMKPDFSLIMLFVVIMVIPDRRIAVVAGIVTGLLTAFTTTFPMGQIPNIVDKLVTTGVVIGLSAVVSKRLMVPVIGVVGTIVSGIVFLGTAALLTGLPTSFGSLMLVVVLPAAAVNTAALLLLYP